jgi:hypothetical protein
MTNETKLVERGTCFIVASGFSRTKQFVERAELWPHAVIIDQDDGKTIISSFLKLPVEIGSNPMKITSCAICDEAIEETAGRPFKRGRHISIEPMGGQSDFLDYAICFGAYMCPACEAKCPDDPVRLLVSTVLGDVQGLRYIKVD